MRPFGGHRRAARADEKDQRIGEIAIRRLENALAEGAGEALLGDEQDQRQPSRTPPRRRRRRRRVGERAADRLADRRRVAVDRDERAARRLRARRGDAAHRVDDRAELADALDARGDVGEPAGHAPFASKACDFALQDRAQVSPRPRPTACRSSRSCGRFAARAGRAPPAGRRGTSPPPRRRADRARPTEWRGSAPSRRRAAAARGAAGRARRGCARRASTARAPARRTCRQSG